MDPAVEARFERIENALASVAVSQASLAMSQAAVEQSMAAAVKRMDRLDRMMGAMARLGRRWRSEANAQMAVHNARMERVEANLAEMSDKLNGLIGVVDNWKRDKPNRAR